MFGRECTNDFGELSEARIDEEQIEDAHRRTGTKNLRKVYQNDLAGLLQSLEDR